MEQAFSYDIDENTVETDETEEKKPSLWKSVFSWLDDLALFFVIFILVLSFIIRPVIVDGTSMYSTLKHGDVVLLYSSFYKLERGDIVVVSSPTKPNDPIIKRVIGLENDVIDIDYDTNTVTVNGNPLTEDYINMEPEDVMEYHALENYSYPYTVPEGKVFCLGDNRNNSRDSRDMKIYGALDEGNVLGKVFFRVFNSDKENKSKDKVFGWVD